MRVNLYGMDGIGRTKTEAKEDAGRHIRAALTGDYAPWNAIVRSGECGVIVWREPSGWNHRLMQSGCHDNRGGTSYASTTTRDEAIRGAVRHLAQAAGLDAVEDLIAGGSPIPSSYLTQEDKDEIRGSEAWQLRYAEGRRQGMDDESARNFAEMGGRAA